MDKNSEVRIGIIGSGDVVSERFFEAAVRNKRCKVTAWAIYELNEYYLVDDLLKQNPRSKTKPHLINRLPSRGNSIPEEFFDAVDAVYIASPNNTHYDYIQQCLTREKHILCEKPLSDNLTRVEDIVTNLETVRGNPKKKPLVFQDCEHYFYQTISLCFYDHVDDFIDQRGRIRHAEFYFREKDMLDKPRAEWLPGVWLDVGSHLLTPLQYIEERRSRTRKGIISDVFDVEKYHYPVESKFKDETALTFTAKFSGTIFQHRAKGEFEIAKCVPEHAVKKRVLFYFGVEETPIRIDFVDQTISQGGAILYGPLKNIPYENLLNRFLDGIENAREILTSPQRSLVVLRDVYRIYTSREFLEKGYADYREFYSMFDNTAPR